MRNCWDDGPLPAQQQIRGRVKQNGRNKGFRYIYAAAANAKSVVLDLDEWGEVWEDFYDGMMAVATRSEPTISLEELKVEMDAEMERERQLYS